MTRVAGKSPANGAADTAVQAEKAARRAQAKAEGAKTGDTVEFKDEKFRLEPGPLPGAASMILAHFGAMDPGVRDRDAEDGVWQVMEMLLAQPSGIPPGEDGFDAEKWTPGEFSRFLRHAGRTRASIEEIVEGPLSDAVEIVAARPTATPPASSPGRPATTPSLTGNSSAEPEPASNS